MQRSAVPAAFQREIIDERAVTLREPAMLGLVRRHPFVAERKSAGA